MAELDYQYIASLVRKTQHGDSDAFAELYAATYQKQYRFAYQYLKDEYLAQDAIQEAYILVLKNISTLKDPKVFISWLNQIIFRICFDMSQKHNRHNQELHIDTDDLDISTLSAIANPEEQIAQQDEKEYIISRIMDLPMYEAQAIMMRYYNNMKIREIADAMNCSKSTIKRYLASGHEKLQKYLR
ncbi:RNA polymerase sigma factor [Lachnospiraceae bacterium LCP25S3_G4]